MSSIRNIEDLIRKQEERIGTCSPSIDQNKKRVIHLTLERQMELDEEKTIEKRKDPSEEEFRKILDLLLEEEVGSY